MKNCFYGLLIILCVTAHGASAEENMAAGDSAKDRARKTIYSLEGLLDNREIKSENSKTQESMLLTKKAPAYSEIEASTICGEIEPVDNAGVKVRSFDQVKCVFGKYSPHFKIKWHRYLRKHEAQVATIILNMNVSPEGKVNSVNLVKSSIGDEVMNHSIKDVASKMLFPTQNVVSWNGDYELTFLP